MVSVGGPVSGTALVFYFNPASAGDDGGAL